MISMSRLDKKLFGRLRMLHAKPGQVIFELNVEEYHTNRLDTYHGGAIAALIDLGGSLAVASNGLFATGVSTDLSVTYIRAGAQASDIIRVEATCDKLGKMLAYTSIKIFDAEQKLFAKGSHTKYVARAWRHPQNQIAPITVPRAPQDFESNVHRALKEHLSWKDLKREEEQDRLVRGRNASWAPDSLPGGEEEDERREWVQRGGTGVWEVRTIPKRPKDVIDGRPALGRRASQEWGARGSLNGHTDKPMEERPTLGRRAPQASSTRPREEEREDERKAWDDDVPQMLLRRQPWYDNHEAAREKARLPKTERVTPMKDKRRARTEGGQSVSKMGKQAAPRQDAQRAQEDDGGVPSEKELADGEEPPRNEGDKIMRKKDLPLDIEDVIEPVLEHHMMQKRPSMSKRNQRKAASRVMKAVGAKFGAPGSKGEVRREKKREKMKEKRNKEKSTTARGPPNSTE